MLCRAFLLRECRIENLGIGNSTIYDCQKITLWFVILGYYQVFLGGAIAKGTDNGSRVRLAEIRSLIPTIKFILGYAW